MEQAIRNEILESYHIISTVYNKVRSNCLYLAIKMKKKRFCKKVTKLSLMKHLIVITNTHIFKN